MFRNLMFGLSALVISTSISIAGAPHHHSAPRAVRGAHPGSAAGHTALDAEEHADLAAEQARITAATPPPQPPSIQDIIRNAFQALGPGAVDWAERIAWCESRYDAHAVNPDSDAQGLFQFLPSTWAGTPFAKASPFDPVANSQAAAWLLQQYGAGQWECQA